MTDAISTRPAIARLARVFDAADYRPGHAISLSGSTKLQTVTEGGEIKFGTAHERDSGKADDFTDEELAACDWTHITMGANGPVYKSGKTGKILESPVQSPAEQIRARRAKEGKK
jgi:hypothetical protein